ncbi:MAG TPA: sigma-54-dependent Fis family transcriptional regulator [Pirellulales bacterium]|nr:sigma-54-dependent Fis family transcriptional regulator [Pirellulales bacterium]
MASQILWTAGQSSEPAAFLNQVLPWVLAAANADFAAVVSASHGAWTEVAAAGPHQAPPAVLLAEALDRERLVRADRWLAAPLEAKAASAELLLLHLPQMARGMNAGNVGRTSSPSSMEGTSSASFDGPEARPTGDQIAASLAAVCGQGLATVRERDRQRRRIERLEAILDIAGRWNQNQQTESLLVEMAEAAARLLHADRASIFLWDRHSHTLVGRPALGVGKEELRIPDNSGIVGRVMQTGLPHRVDLADDHEQINRQVDAQLHYRTRTLLCVPLRSRRGELFGVFETINKRDGNFSEEDEATLVEFAAQAAIALENAQERQALLQSRRLIAEQASQGVRLIGENPAIEALRATIGRVAKTDLAVLILGENGTGKEVVSQSIHYQSARRDQPFIAVNCAAISETLLESELFGHEKGAFTDAHETRAGKFELASGGTLFLDEIGDLSPSGQAKLLRVLEEKIVVRVGGSKPIHTDARVIAATNQDLAEMASQKKFRQDLYFRLNVVALQIPPLRERREDILVLAEHFLGDFCHKARRKPIELSAGARRKLEAHAWPGNVRELRNLMERLAYLAPADTIEADDPAFILAPSGAGPAAVARGDLSLNEATSSFQSAYIEQAIASAGGNMNEAARRLGVHRSNLYRKMRLLGMQSAD